MIFSIERLRQKVKRLLKASIKDEMVDNVAGFLIFAAIIIGLAICIAYITSSENQHCYQAVQIAMADKSTRENL